MFGNGMRPGIWGKPQVALYILSVMSALLILPGEFVKRFGVWKIGEFYGSTEGNSSIRKELPL